MPFVNTKTLKGALSNEQKQDLHQRITDVMVDIEGRGKTEFRNFVMIMIDELEPQNASVGGRQASEEFVRRLTNSTSRNKS
jgi:4-oxalocrotonate tautomerase family enzyme